MHGLIFKTSISLLAGSTRYLTEQCSCKRYRAKIRRLRQIVWSLFRAQIVNGRSHSHNPCVERGPTGPIHREYRSGEHRASQYKHSCAGWRESAAPGPRHRGATVLSHIEKHKAFTCRWHSVRRRSLYWPSAASIRLAPHIYSARNWSSGSRRPPPSMWRIRCHDHVSSLPYCCLLKGGHFLS